MNAKDQIIALLTPLLQDDKYFIVEVKVSPSKIRPKITVLLDSDAGISIDECADISRALGEAIEAQDLMPDAYTLEVSSPGVDFPLASPRQFRKNVGRTLRVILKDGSEKKGELRSADDHSFVLAEELKKIKQDQELPLLTLAYDQILKAEVQVKF